MIMRDIRRKIKKGLIALGLCAMPLAITVSCNPRYGTLDVLRYDDDFDSFDVFTDDCFLFDCSYYDEIILFD